MLITQPPVGSAVSVYVSSAQALPARKTPADNVTSMFVFAVIVF